MVITIQTMFFGFQNENKLRTTLKMLSASLFQLKTSKENAYPLILYFVRYKILENILIYSHLRNLHMKSRKSKLKILNIMNSLKEKMKFF